MDKKIKELSRKVKTGDVEAIAPLVTTAARTNEMALGDAFTTIFKSLDYKQLQNLFYLLSEELNNREIKRKDKEEVVLHLQRTKPISIAPMNTGGLGRMSLHTLVAEVHEFAQKIKSGKSPRLLDSTHGNHNSLLAKARENLEKVNTDDIFVSISKLRVFLGYQESEKVAKSRATRNRKKIRAEIAQKKIQAKALEDQLKRLQGQIEDAEKFDRKKS